MCFLQNLLCRVNYNIGLVLNLGMMLEYFVMNFKQKVYEITDRIPKGKVATYGQIAKMAGSPAAARAVGMCMKTNTNAPITPCHRVVAADGSLTGYSAGEGVSTKRNMLMAEGVKFKGNKVDLALSGWK